MDLVGKCLVARPNINDPFFKKSVVYIYEQSPSGVSGVVINIKKQPYTINDIFRNRGFTVAEPPEPLYQGGPVNEKAIIMLHTSEWRSTNTLQVSDHVSISSDDMMIFKFVNGDKPNAYRFCSGAAIWHPQQMRSEIANNNWLVSKLNVRQLFDFDGRNQWETAVEITAKNTIDRYI